jgi:hypothetical protein
VPVNITLGKLHTVIQFAIGWEGGHMHEFEIAGENYGIPDPDEWGPPINSETRKTLIKALNGKKTFSYLYDFGDGWDHRVKIEKKLPAGVCPQMPYCIEGANACPPEDIGGAPGYTDFLEVMADPNHPQVRASRYCISLRTRGQSSNCQYQRLELPTGNSRRKAVCDFIQVAYVERWGSHEKP